MLFWDLVTPNAELNIVHYFFMVKAAETCLEAYKQTNTGKSGTERWYHSKTQW
jgi:hypothetical protein